MNRSTQVALCFASLLTLGQASWSADKLHVMLQGGSAPDLRDLVEQHGGTTTHELPIIDAIGAMLEPDQLQQVLASPLVIRHIDDLLVTEHEEKPPGTEPKTCDVGGALELDFNATSISWPLYNKHPGPANLKTLELAWPETLGRVSDIRLGQNTVDPELIGDTTPGKLMLDLGQQRTIAVNGRADLLIAFESPQNSSLGQPLRQSDFSITATFDGDCSTRLMPAYRDNHENFYYATVAGADALHRHGITGRGVTVAVLDSGLWEHESLANNTTGESRILARYDAITNIAGREAYDESGHGTHMTSVIAHNGPTLIEGKPSGTFKGIAPDVDLVVIKAFDVEGQGDLLDIVRGIQWAVDNREKYNIRILNLSFAARPRWDYWQDPINQAVMRAWASGITVVAAAGNEGPGDMTIGSPGNLPYIITVGAITDSWTIDSRDDDYIPDFSSRGPTPNAHIKPDIVAPGGHITGVTRPGSTLTRENPEYILRSGEFVMTGSSQASALVSGIVALLLQLEPELSPDDVKCKLTSSAEPAINRDGLLAYSPFQQGHGLISATRAVTLGKKGCGNSDLDIEKDMQGIEHYRGPAIVDENGAVSLPGLVHMVSPQPSANGYSEIRKWGVKAHIERSDPPLSEEEMGRETPFDWQQLYEEERSRIEKLSRTPPSKPGPSDQ